MSPHTLPASTPTGRRDRLLSSFQIVRSPSYTQGRPYQQTRLAACNGPAPSVLPARLKDYRNWNGHSYAESHVEEWVSKHPAALYPGQTVQVLASQNYARLGEKIDALLLDSGWQFHTLELKAERVASNRGITPDQIQGQMTRYVNFLRNELLGFPASLADYYAQFTAAFLGSPHNLAKSLEQAFGKAFLPRTRPLVLCRTFVTEGYDDAAVDYFRARQLQEDGPIRLVYYRFFPAPESHRIEFWEVPLNPNDGSPGDTGGNDNSVGHIVSVSTPAPQHDADPSVTEPKPADDHCRESAPAAAVYLPSSCGISPGLDAAAYIVERQVLWARRHRIALQGSAGERGRPAYTRTVEENLFEPLSAEARREYEQGQGDELQQNMRAVHSSSALTCNLFHYWKKRGQAAAVAAACGLPAAAGMSMRFEARHPIAANLNREIFPYDPNPDVEFLFAPGHRVRASALECKLGEPYGTRGHAGIKRAYLAYLNIWDALPHCRELAARLCPADNEFKHLHAAQLLKHVLGLRHSYGLTGFILTYLWYDVPGNEGAQHRQELETFAAVVRQDGIEFRAVTYQQVLLNLAREQYHEHASYVDYLAERYL